MKSYLFKISLGLLLVIATSFSFAQKSVVEFEKSTQKFNKVNEGEVVKLTYTFKNLGKHTLSIVPPEVDCSCTEVKIPENKIAGGASDSIIVIFNTKDKIGFQQRDVKIQFVSDLMDSQSIDKTITFKGMVKASEATKKKYKSNH